MFDLTGKRALITGASSGLGWDFAKTLASAGAEVVLAARRRERLETLAAEIRADGGTALVVEMDVTKPNSIQSAFDEVTASGPPASIIVNNSGVSRESWLHEMSEEDWAMTLETNLSGVWRVAKEAAKALMQAGQPGSIINIASITAFRTTHTIGAYAASKAAVEHLTKSMALEWARHGIRVNSLAPGYISTDINAKFMKTEAAQAMIKRIPMRRYGELRELAAPLLLLASDAGSYMTGSTIVVDGGHLQSAL